MGVIFAATMADAVAHFYTFLNTLAPLAPEDKELLQQAISVKHLQRHEYLLQEGQVCKYIDFVVAGGIRAYYNKDGADYTTALYVPGACVTDMKSLVSGESSIINIQTVSKATIVRLHKESMLQLYKVSADVQAIGRAVLQHMLIKDNDWKEMYALYAPEDRYAYLLNKQPDLLQYFSLQHVASFLGIRRETLSRIRARKAK